MPRVGALLDDAVGLRPAHLVVDLAECESLDAAGIALLLDIHRRIRGAGGRLTLRGLSPRLRRLLQIARVDRVLHTATAPAGYQPRHRPRRRQTDDTPTADRAGDNRPDSVVPTR